MMKDIPLGNSSRHSSLFSLVVFGVCGVLLVCIIATGWYWFSNSNLSLPPLSNAVPATNQLAAAVTALPAGVTNSITLTNVSGTTQTNYPFQFGRPFVQGEIPSYPLVSINGTPVPTQADIKNRYSDGSVLFAVISVLVPTLPAGGSVTLTLTNQSSGNNTALSQSEMLDPKYDFDAAMYLTQGGTTVSASARDMLADGNYTVWTSGPIATTLILRDNSAARKYDIGFDSLRPIRPEFIATFWPGINKVKVTTIGENANTETLEDVKFDLVVLKAGHATPATVFTQSDRSGIPGVEDYAATRWARTFWVGSTPAPQVNVNYNMAYLVNVPAFPNFDPTLTPSAASISSAYTYWVTKPRNLYESGGWQIDQGTAGGRDEIGNYPGVMAQWLYSGDYRLYEINARKAELAGAWPMMIREGDPSKFYDTAKTMPAIGLPVSVYARPTYRYGYDVGTAQDKIDIQGTRFLNADLKYGGGWRANEPHQPEPFAGLYLMTGDYFYLEQMQLWAAKNVVRQPTDYRGPGGVGGGFYTEIRGFAWGFRSRFNAAYLSPDGSPEKTYLNQMVNDAIAFMEGMHHITGTRFEGTPVWNVAKSQFNFTSPIHIFTEGGNNYDTQFPPGTVSAAAGLWQNSLVVYELGRAKELGYPVDALFSWAAKVLTGQYAERATYDLKNIDTYALPVKDGAGVYFPSWTEISKLLPTHRSQLSNDVADGYATYAYGASTMLLGEPNGPEIYAWLRDNFYTKQRSEFAKNPKWAFLPRGVSAGSIPASTSGNVPPTANAGPDKSITLPTPSSAPTGTVCSDPDGPITVSWVRNGGTGTATPTITNGTSCNPTFTNLASAGTYIFRLTVTENGVSATDTMTVTVTGVAVNVPPTASAGPDKAITLPTSSIAPTGTTCTDPDGSVTILWARNGGTGTATPTITNRTSCTPTFTNLTTAGTYIFRLTVTQNSVSTTDDMIVTVSVPGATPPTADAGPDKTITLPVSSSAPTGTTCTDPDGVVTIAWARNGGTGSATPTIANGTSCTPSFSGMTTDGTYIFRLTVTQAGVSSTDEMTVNVNAAPVIIPVTTTPDPDLDPDLDTTPTDIVGTPSGISAGLDITTNNIPISGVAPISATCANEDGMAKVSWAQVGGTGSSRATIGNPTTCYPLFTNITTPGTYIFRITVTRSGVTTTDDLTVSVGTADTFSSATPTTPSTVPTSTTRPIFPRTLFVGARGEDVRTLQKFLAAEGFTVVPAGEETTFYGSATSAAVTRFQEAHREDILTPIGYTSGTGTLGPATIKFISGTTPTITAPAPPVQTGNTPGLSRVLKIGFSGSDVASLQNYLITHGYLSGSATGYFGSLTRGAVQQLQCRHGIACSGDEYTTGWGLVGAQTRAVLR